MSKSKKPRISVNKLAEYLEATPTRRKKIIYDAKYPSKFIVTRYADIRETITMYFQKGQDENILLSAIAKLEKKKPETEFQEQDIALSIESLEMLLETDTTALEGLDIEAFTSHNELVTISGVDISINPDMVLKKKTGNKTNVGTAKIHLSKNNYLSLESQKIVAALLHDYTQKHISKEAETPNQKLSLSLDVFQQTIECSPTGFKVRMRNIEAACEEIALWWDKV